MKKLINKLGMYGTIVASIYAPLIIALLFTHNYVWAGLVWLVASMHMYGAMMKGFEQEKKDKIDSAFTNFVNQMSEAKKMQLVKETTVTKETDMLDAKPMAEKAAVA